MNRNDAQQIATRIADIWPRGGIATHIIEEILQAEYSDTERARRAIESMKREATFFNIPAFHNAYIATQPTHITGEPAKCTDCGNDGWTTTEPFTRHQRTYTATKPCPYCKHGKRAQHSTTWKQRLIDPTHNTQPEDAA